jgi:hypothetical protein
MKSVRRIIIRLNPSMPKCIDVLRTVIQFEIYSCIKPCPDLNNMGKALRFQRLSKRPKAEAKVSNAMYLGSTLLHLEMIRDSMLPDMRIINKIGNIIRKALMLK